MEVKRGLMKNNLIINAHQIVAQSAITSVIAISIFIMSSCGNKNELENKTHSVTRLKSVDKKKSALSPEKVFKINTRPIPPYTTEDKNGLEDSLAKELYTRLGMKPIIHHVPSERGLANLNFGIDDGIMSRISGLEKVYPNIIRFGEVVVEWRFVAFSRRKDIQISGWNSLQPYNIGFITGWKVFEMNVIKYKSLTKVRSAKQLFKMLDSKRVDIVVYALLPGLWEIRNLGLKNIYPLKKVLAKRKKYFYIHKKHKKLIERGDRILKEMRQDGTFETLYQKTVGTLTKGK